MKAHKIFIKLIIIFFALAICSISTFFNTGFFEWWGFDNMFFIWACSILIVCMMDALFQVFIFFIRSKKIAAACFILLAWLIFFFSSVGCTIIGMWYKTDRAKQERIDIVSDKANIDPNILILDKQIESQLKIVDGYQGDYEKESNWWVKSEKIKPYLETAQKELNRLREDRKAITESKVKIAESQELFVSENKELDPVVKIFLSIAFGVIIDIGSCLIIMFSWIFDKETAIKIENIKVPDAKEYDTKIEEEKLEGEPDEKEKTLSEYTEIYYDYRVRPDTSILKGGCPNNIPIKTYNTITAAAKALNIIITEKTVSKIVDRISKNEFVDRIMDYINNKDLMDIF